MDINEIATRIVKETTSEKNPAAVMLGRLGLKVSKARTEKLNEKRRKEITKKAGMKRWGKK